MTRLIAQNLLFIKAFWLGCLVLALGQNVQAVPPCHAVAEPVAGCEWCVTSTEVLDQEIQEISALAFVAADGPVLVPLTTIALEWESTPFLQTRHLNKAPPDIATSVDWFTDQIRLRI